MPKLSNEEVEDLIEDRVPKREWKERKKKVLDANAEKKDVKKTDAPKREEQ